MHTQVTRVRLNWVLVVEIALNIDLSSRLLCMLENLTRSCQNATNDSHTLSFLDLLVVGCSKTGLSARHGCIAVWLCHTNV